MRWLATTVFATTIVGFAFSASAADMPVKAPVYKAPVVVEASNWTGFYIGGNVDYSWGKTDIDYAQALGNPNGFGVVAGPATLFLTQGLDPKSVIGGGQVGYNYQMNNWVWGIVADFDFRNGKDQVTLGPLNGFGDTLTLSTKQGWLGTVRSRLGVTIAARWLIYATGGFAYGRVDHSVNQTAFAGAATIVRTFSGQATKSGWVAGAGTELAFSDHWSVAAEYLYVDLGVDTLTIGPSPAIGVAPPGAFPATTVTFNDRSHIARILLNYKF